MQFNAQRRSSVPTVLTLDAHEAGPLSIRAKSLVFVDPVSLELLSLIERVAPSDAPVLMNGDTGTGKELVARHIHRLSRRSGPFMAVNCGAITEQLAEAELFGHEAGAFTGAQGKREGWFEAANHGTLFLDEIGDLPRALQVKLLRVLQEREIVRLGSRKSIPIDVRLVAATNVDLNEAVSAGHFRLDLFYRLNIVQLRLPPLHERIGDILPLARHFLSVYSKRLNLPEPELGLDAVRALEAYQWPGNIRELENVIHFAMLVASDEEIRPEHLKLSGRIGSDVVASHPAGDESAAWQQLRGAVRTLLADGDSQLLRDVEQLVVDEAFRECNRNQVRSAALLGVTRNVMRTLLKRYGHLAEGASDSLIDVSLDSPLDHAA